MTSVTDLLRPLDGTWLPGANGPCGIARLRGGLNGAAGLHAPTGLRGLPGLHGATAHL
ncbi:hypothetical protein [Actinomadura sp. NBRC 104412]|uniref:hypothetical protein n=1 Tax=Actinomadura sp. NBRC 104412 TaxID=3032203 RepID=UPI00255291FA|nr:hypothetical protein [Actinomadura sp. NBRC 104412]